MGKARRLGGFCVVAVSVFVAACEPEEIHPRTEDGEEAGQPVAPTEEAREEVEAEERRQALPQDGEEPVTADVVGTVAVCGVCHGPDGQGSEALGAPRVAGLEAWYVARQLEYFREGIRAETEEDIHGTQMRAVAMMLGEGPEADALGAYWEDVEAQPAPVTVSGDEDQGAEIYQTCVACHGEAAAGGRELGTPSMVGQHDWYLVRQIGHFRDGVRELHPEDAAATDKAEAMAPLDTDAAINVVAYINSLQGN